MKIAFFEVIDWEANFIKEQLSDHELSFFTGGIGKGDKLSEPFEAISVFVGSELNESFFRENKDVRFIVTRSTGFDHIDLNAAKASNVMISNVPAYGDNTVAEHTFALILTVMKKMYQSIKRVREQGWFSYEGLRGYDLKGKTLGVVGTGRIGGAVIRIANGFGMKVIAYDPYPSEPMAKELGYEYVEFKELIRSSDVITLHAPYLPATHHMLNQQSFQYVKPGAIIINTSRGALIETQALVDALRSGIVAGAGLDVLEEEGFIKDEVVMMTLGHPSEQQLKVVLADHELMYMDNVVITPHNAFQTQEAIKRILETSIENVKAYASGSPKNIVS